MPSASETTELAASWLIRLEGPATPELWEEFETWLEESPRHRAAFIRLRTAWNRADIVKLLRPTDGTIDSDLLGRLDIAPEAQPPAPVLRPNFARARQQQTPKRADTGSERRRWLVAAGLGCVAIAGALYGTLRTGGDDYETEIGGRQQIALSDGSHVDLNTDSELVVRLTATRRDLTLVRGEALFRVAHDTQRPFYVIAGGTVVRAVGTEFSVRIHDDNRVEVLVTEGRVAVGDPVSTVRPTLPPSASAVSAGERATDNRGHVSISKMPTTDMQRKLAWTTGWLLFQGDSLDEVVNEFNRYNRRHLLIADDAITHKPLGGNFHTTELDSFVDTLEHSFGVKALRAPDGSAIRLIASPDSPDGDSTPEPPESRARSTR
jgi:transmembrane sensor